MTIKRTLLILNLFLLTNIVYSQKISLTITRFEKIDNTLIIDGFLSINGSKKVTFGVPNEIGEYHTNGILLSSGFNIIGDTLRYRCYVPANLSITFSSNTDSTKVTRSCCTHIEKLKRRERYSFRVLFEGIKKIPKYIALPISFLDSYEDVYLIGNIESAN